MGLNNWKDYKSKKKRIIKKHRIKSTLWIGNAKGPSKKQMMEEMAKRDNFR